MARLELACNHPRKIIAHEWNFNMKYGTKGGLKQNTHAWWRIAHTYILWPMFSTVQTCSDENCMQHVNRRHKGKPDSRFLVYLSSRSETHLPGFAGRKKKKLRRAKHTVHTKSWQSLRNRPTETPAMRKNLSINIDSNITIKKVANRSRWAKDEISRKHAHLHSQQPLLIA
jgi:hypothetical protein